MSETKERAERYKMHLKAGWRICQAMIFRGNLILLLVCPDHACTAFKEETNKEMQQ